MGHWLPHILWGEINKTAKTGHFKAIYCLEIALISNFCAGSISGQTIF